MSANRITPFVFQFLNRLKENNNLNWFAAEKQNHEEAAAIIAAFADKLLEGLNKQDVIETVSGSKSLRNISRHFRFTKGDNPYKTYFRGNFKRAGKHRRGGYYYHIEPGGKSFLLCGFWHPSGDDLSRIRDDIAYNPAGLNLLINEPGFIANFGRLRGEVLSTIPRGYPKDHEAIELLRLKQILVQKFFTDEEVLSSGFTDTAVQTFLLMRPFLDHISEILTVDGNGLPL
jgi:uncharacterized protein (TIGR02453 family)